MPRGTTARLSGSQIRDLGQIVGVYASQWDVKLSDVVVSVNLQSGRIVLTDRGWDDREILGEHADSSPQPETIRGFSASIVF